MFNTSLVTFHEETTGMEQGSLCQLSGVVYKVVGRMLVVKTMNGIQHGQPKMGTCRQRWSDPTTSSYTLMYLNPARSR